jgi:hypothetical protein
MNAAVNDPEMLEALYWQEGLSMRRIADRLDCSEATVRRKMVQYGIDRRGTGYSSKQRERDTKRPARYRTRANGYEAWEGSLDYDGFSVTFVHQLVLVAEGEDPHKVYSDDWHTHHKNEIKWDNRAENLTLMTASDHLRHHANERDFGSEVEYTEEELLDYLQQAIDLIGRVPTCEEMNDSPFPPVQTYEYRFGTWKEALSKIDEEPHTEAVNARYGRRAKSLPNQDQMKGGNGGNGDVSQNGGNASKQQGGECPMCGEEYGHSLARHLPCGDNQ